MSQDRPGGFDEWLDVVVSRYVEHHGPMELAQRLIAAANGLVELAKPQARWDEHDEVVIVPFDRPEELEARLEEFLTLRAICVPVEGVPMQRDISVRIAAGPVSVQIPARAIQRTAAGIVFQLSPDSPDIQRALVSLPGALRSAPPVDRALNHKVVRRPHLLAEEEADALLSGPTEPDPPPNEAAEPHEKRERVGEPALEPSTGESSTRPERHATEELTLLAATAARLGNESLFEVLGVHFTATGEETRAVRDRVLRAVEVVLAADPDEETAAQARRVREEIDSAARTLADPRRRSRHRDAVVYDYKIDTAISMYEQQADTAKLRRDIEAAVGAYQRLVELRPDNAEYRQQLGALEALLS